jgi:hypothetical protein
VTWRIESGIRTPDQEESIIPTIGMPFPVSTRIHCQEDHIAGLSKGEEIEDHQKTRYRLFMPSIDRYQLFVLGFQRQDESTDNIGYNKNQDRTPGKSVHRIRVFQYGISWYKQTVEKKYNDKNQR